MNFLHLFILFFISFNFAFSLIPKEQIIFNAISLDDLNVDYNETLCNKVIDSLINLVSDIYIYNDIAKHPPNEDYYGKIDIIEELKKIETKDRKYYDFYRDIKRVIAKTKDLHFLLSAKNFTENGILMDKIYMCFPFSLYIDGNSTENAEMYIKINPVCFTMYTEEEQQFISGHLEIPIESINNDSPFNYIQNFASEYINIKNKHGMFSIMMSYFNSFPIFLIPLSKEETTNIEFSFNDGNSITLNYSLLYLNTEKEDIIKEFKSKDSQKETSIQWKYFSSEFKCLIDDINEVNVFQQTGMSLSEENKEIIKKCTEEFYNNSYPIIGIESLNQGGSKAISSYLEQLLQVKILPRYHESLKYSETIFNHVDKTKFLDAVTCEPIKDFIKIEDDYGKGIKHYRTQVFQDTRYQNLKEMKELREGYLSKKNLKKPTEIIIFTDFFSYSATSYFIKGLQETGSAIIVGYGGNPILTDEPLDASLSPSGSIYYGDIPDYQNLIECGFQIMLLTSYESFNYTYQSKNPIPKEYLINPVDERVNIYQAYDDSLYDIFIQEAKKIFDKYNKEGKCNKDNLLLTYEPDNGECYIFEEDPFAHGGYQCDINTGMWSQVCKPFYCDIGYYFDTFQNKCIKDLCTEDEEDTTDSENTDSDKGNLSHYLKFPCFIILIEIINLLV